MPRDRWILGFTAGTLVLVVLAILAVSLAGGREPVKYPAEDPVRKREKDAEAVGRATRGACAFKLM